MLLERSAQSMASRSAVPSTGLRKKAEAFICCAFRRVPYSSSAETMMIDKCRPRALNSSSNLLCDSSSIPESSITHPESPELRASRNSFAAANSWTLKFAVRSSRASPLLADGSASTINTCFPIGTELVSIMLKIYA